MPVYLAVRITRKPTALAVPRLCQRGQSRVTQPGLEGMCVVQVDAEIIGTLLVERGSERAFRSCILPPGAGGPVEAVGPVFVVFFFFLSVHEVYVFGYRVEIWQWFFLTVLGLAKTVLLVFRGRSWGYLH